MTRRATCLALVLIAPHATSFAPPAGAVRHRPTPFSRSTALHSALDPTSVALVAISAAAMSGFAADRHARYVALHKEGDRSNGDPSTRWRMIPLVW